MSNINYQTKRCIRCDKPAKLWTGFVQDRWNRAVLAGWCGRRCMSAWMGYHGLYRARSGKERT